MSHLTSNCHTPNTSNSVPCARFFQMPSGAFIVLYLTATHLF